MRASAASFGAALLLGMAMIPSGAQDGPKRPRGLYDPPEGWVGDLAAAAAQGKAESKPLCVVFR